MSAKVIDLCEAIEARIDEAKATLRAIDVMRAALKPGCRLLIDADGKVIAWPRHVAIPPGTYQIGAGIKEAQPCRA